MKEDEQGVSDHEVENSQENLTPAPSLKGREEQPARLRYVPNRHDRRKAAAEARKEAKRKGKK